MGLRKSGNAEFLQTWKTNLQPIRGVFQWEIQRRMLFIGQY